MRVCTRACELAFQFKFRKELEENEFINYKLKQ